VALRLLRKESGLPPIRQNPTGRNDWGVTANNPIICRPRAFDTARAGAAVLISAEVQS
jgi:hypothetical protein